MECQEVECQEEEGRTLEEHVNFEANPSKQVNPSEQVIRIQVVQKQHGTDGLF